MKRSLTVLALTAGLLGPALPGIAAPGPVAPQTAVGDARQAAAALRARVDALRDQAEIATEAYDEAYAELGAAVTSHLTAEREVQRAQQAVGSGEAERQQRVRALYMSGGTSTLYASVLSSTDLTEALGRLQQVSRVLSSDTQRSAVATGALAAQRSAETRLATSADASTALQQRVAARAEAVHSLLDRTTALLAQADVTVVRLAEEQRRADEAAAAARAVRVLAAAQAAARAAAAATLAASGTLTDGAPTGLPGVGVRPPVGTAPAGTAPATSPRASVAMAFASAQLGKPYVWGATGAASYDCSGLTGAAWGAAGVNLPRTSRQQWYAGPHVALGDLQPGDLLFWASNVANPATIHHVALYAGNGLMIAAPHTGDVVKIQPVYLDGYVGAVRPGA